MVAEGKKASGKQEIKHSFMYALSNYRQKTPPSSSQVRIGVPKSVSYLGDVPGAGAEADEADVDKVRAKGHGERPGVRIAVPGGQLPESLVPGHLGLRTSSDITNLGRVQDPDLLGNQREEIVVIIGFGSRLMMID